MSLAEQLGNAGSDFERAVRWKQKKQGRLAARAAARALEQLDRTLADDRFVGPSRREIARLREEVCRELFSGELRIDSAQQLQRYFLAFATKARRAKGL
jgi:plasmid stabilization system protein ParE